MFIIYIGAETDKCEVILTHTMDLELRADESLVKRARDKYWTIAGAYGMLSTGSYLGAISFENEMVVMGSLATCFVSLIRVHRNMMYALGVKNELDSSVEINFPWKKLRWREGNEVVRAERYEDLSATLDDDDVILEYVVNGKEHRHISLYVKDGSTLVDKINQGA